MLRRAAVAWAPCHRWAHGPAFPPAVHALLERAHADRDYGSRLWHQADAAQLELADHAVAVEVPRALLAVSPTAATTAAPTADVADTGGVDGPPDMAAAAAVLFYNDDDLFTPMDTTTGAATRAVAEAESFTKGDVDADSDSLGQASGGVASGDVRAETASRFGPSSSGAEYAPLGCNAAPRLWFGGELPPAMHACLSRYAAAHRLPGAPVWLPARSPLWARAGPSSGAGDGAAPAAAPRESQEGNRDHDDDGVADRAAQVCFYLLGGGAPGSRVLPYSTPAERDTVAAQLGKMGLSVDPACCLGFNHHSSVRVCGPLVPPRAVVDDVPVDVMPLPTTPLTTRPSATANAKVPQAAATHHRVTPGLPHRPPAFSMPPAPADERTRSAVSGPPVPPVPAATASASDAESRRRSIVGRLHALSSDASPGADA